MSVVTLARKHCLGAILTLLTIGTLLLSNPYTNYLVGIAEASDDLFSNNFEDNSFDQWEVQDDTWTIRSVNGSRRFGSEISWPNGSTHATAGSTSWTNYSFDIDIFAESGSDKNLMFRYKDINNKYGLHIVNFQDHKFDGICLEKWVNGSFSDKCKWGIPIYNQTVIPVRILAVGTAVKVYVNHSKIFDESNWGPVDSGKIGLRIATGANYPASVWYDNITVQQQSTFPTPLPVPLLKQTNDQWGSETYDHAPQWASPAPPTIGRWGCAITSAAMTFLYHGINFGPDGSSVTPKLINTWLLNEPDGYVNGGNVNWWALRRFSLLANGRFGSPILDFRKLNYFNSGLLDTHLSNNRPDIIGVKQNGHFVVATGPSLDSYFINDPYYSKTELSEYSQTNSMMSYFPTHTNLSALYLTVNPGVELFLTNPDGLRLGKDPSSGELFTPAETNYDIVPPLLDEESDQPSGPGFQELALPIPPDSNYNLSVWSNSISPFTLEIIGYNKNGDPFIKNLDGIVDGNFPSLINFSFSQIDPSGVQNAQKTVTFDSFENDIRLAYNLNWITTAQTRNQLINIVSLLEKQDANNRDNPGMAAANHFRDRLIKLENQKEITVQAKKLFVDDLGQLGY